MTTWILAGVAVIVLVAVIVRLLFGGASRRHAPLVLGDQKSRRNSSASASDESSQDEAALHQSQPADAEVTELDRTSIHSPSVRMSESRLDSVRADDPVPFSGLTSDSNSADPEPVSPVPASVVNRSATETVRPTGTPRSIFSDFRGIVHSTGEPLSMPEPEELPINDDDLTFGSATPALAQMLPESQARKEKQRQDLSAAGYHSRGAWLNLNSVRFVLAFLALMLVGLGLIVAPPAAEPYLLAALIGAPLVAWSLPPLLVSSKASERRTDIERGLPDALDMLNMGVSQGLTVQSSLRRIGPEIAPAHPELAEELRIVDQQARMGTLNQALHNFSQRMDSTEVTSFTSLLIQSEATGTSVSRALSDYSDSMRSTFRERADSRANAASFKLLFPTVLCLMPSVFLFLLGPAVVSMSDFFGGTATELLQGRENAINSLDQAPRVIPEDQ